MSEAARPAPRVLEALELGMLSVHQDVRLFASALARAAPGAEVIPMPRPRVHGDFVTELRALAADVGLEALYGPRIDELALEHAMLRARTRAERQRLARLRWGDGSTVVTWEGRELTLEALARELLALPVRPVEVPSPRARPRPEDAIDPDPLGRLARFAASSGLAIDVKFEPSLVADAVSGERALFLRPSAYRVRDLARLAAHEIHGHLTAAENARHQPLALLRIGCAGSWEDQEGVALVLEQRAGALDHARLRTLGARVTAVLMWLDDATETETRCTLAEVHGFSTAAATTIARRGFRAGGTARDLSYLTGYTRVRDALASGLADLHTLRMGRVSVAALPELARQRARGLVVAARQRPSLAKSLRETFSGTSFATSPPRRAASFTRFEDT